MYTLIWEEIIHWEANYGIQSTVFSPDPRTPLFYESCTNNQGDMFPSDDTVVWTMIKEPIGLQVHENNYFVK